MSLESSVSANTEESPDVSSPGSKDAPLDFIVGGIPRSGTTALSIALCAHPDVYAYASETGLFRQAADFLSDGPVPSSQFPTLRAQIQRDLETALTLHTKDFVEQQARDIKLLARVAGERKLFPLFDEKAATTFTKEVLERFAGGHYGTDFLEDLSRFMAAAFRKASGRDIVGEKTPDNLRVMDSIHSAMPDCHAIAIVRDPLATLRSMALRAKRGMTHDQEFSSHLMRNIGLYLSNVRTLRSVETSFDGETLLTVRYEDMLSDTGRVMRKAFAHLGASVNDEAVELACEIIQPRPNSTTADGFFDSVERVVISRILQPFVADYGYELALPQDAVTCDNAGGACDPELVRQLESEQPALLAMSGFYGDGATIEDCWMAASGVALLVVPDDTAQIVLEVWTGLDEDEVREHELEILSNDVRVAQCNLGNRGERSTLTIDRDDLLLKPLFNNLHYSLLDFKPNASYRPINSSAEDSSDDLREQSVQIIGVTFRDYEEVAQRQRTSIQDLREQITGQRHLIVEAERRAARMEEHALALGRELDAERALLTDERERVRMEQQRVLLEFDSERQDAAMAQRRLELEQESERAAFVEERQRLEAVVLAEQDRLVAEIENDREGAEREFSRLEAERERERQEASLNIERERREALLNIEHERARADELLASSSWRLTAPLRKASRGARWGKQISKRIVWKVGKTGIAVLPMPEGIRSRLKQMIASRVMRVRPDGAPPAHSSILMPGAVADQPAVAHDGVGSSEVSDTASPVEQIDQSDESVSALSAKEHTPTLEAEADTYGTADTPAPHLAPDVLSPAKPKETEGAAVRFKHAAARERNRPENVLEPAYGVPEVSIIIPVYNQIVYTLQCITSVKKYTNAISYEIIVVDDCSSDQTEALLSADDRIRYIRNEENLGFIGSCHAGVNAAQGRYFVFLNNDTETLTNWLVELVETLEWAPEAGIAGSQLIYPNGILQEAGGIVWQDGSAWNYGRMKDPLAPEISYLREADYVSGAALAITADLWAESGGFDFHYKPAYGEDSDLAFRVRSLGYKVYYQPLSKVIHYEGITSGTDTGSGVKAYQVENAKKLFERWKGDLESHRPNGEQPEFEKERGKRKRLLVIDACTPEPDKDAGSITAWEIMRAAQHLGYKVTFIAESNFTYMDKYTDDLARVGIESIYHPFCTSVRQHLNERGSDYDAVLVFRAPNISKYLVDIKKYTREARLILHASDLHFLRAERQADVLGEAGTSDSAAELKRQELDVISSADCVIVHSTHERDLLEDEEINAEVVVFPWILDVKGCKQPFNEREGMMFLGGYQHDPNVDAVEYFARDIWPLVKQDIPDAMFYAVGSNPPDSFMELEGDGFEIVGFVEDLAPYLDRCRLAVVPLRYGAGIKGKLAMTMSYGLPSVSTSIGAEGMELENETEVLVADDPEEFARDMVRLYQDATLWSRLSEGGLDYVNRTYSREEGFRLMRLILKTEQDA